MDVVDDYAWMCVRCKKQVYWFQTDDAPDPDQPTAAQLLQREWERHYDALDPEARDAS
jgi:hypothetical protein